MLFNSNSVSDTYQLAKRLTQNISNGNIIALIGDLGTGKTTFTKGVAAALGIKENVGSPTFKLVSEYKGEDSWLYHIDAYRLKGSNDFLNIGGEEYLNTEKGITIIEWADIILQELPNHTIEIKLSWLGENRRSIETKNTVNLSTYTSK